MQAFDLVDTLVHINYKGVFGHTSLLEQISKAKVIYTPTAPFRVFTAQPDNAEVHQAISDMVHKNFTNCEGISFVTGGTQQVADAKAALIKSHNITDFTDNNRQILAKIKEQTTDVKLWVMTGEGRKPY